MTEKKITKDMGIVEAVQKYPATAEVLMQEGMHCIGCMAARFETLEQGLQVHGKDEKEIKEIIDKMNKTAEESTKE